MMGAHQSGFIRIFMTDGLHKVSAFAQSSLPDISPEIRTRGAFAGAFSPLRVTCAYWLYYQPGERP